MTVDELIAACKEENPTFEHIVTPIEEGLLLVSRADVNGSVRELSLVLPAHMLPRRVMAETYHLEACLRSLRNPSGLVKHVPGAPPAEECGTPVS